jgi:hypothetical protein
MTSTKNQSDKQAKPSSSAQDAAIVKRPNETKRELTDHEIASVAGGGKMLPTELLGKKQ